MESESPGEGEGPDRYFCPGAEIPSQVRYVRKTQRWLQAALVANSGPYTGEKEGRALGTWDKRDLC